MKRFLQIVGGIALLALVLYATAFAMMWIYIFRHVH